MRRAAFISTHRGTPATLASPLARGGALSLWQLAWFRHGSASFQVGVEVVAVEQQAPAITAWRQPAELRQVVKP
jgi:hypothetical protein